MSTPISIMERCVAELKVKIALSECDDCSTHHHVEVLNLEDREVIRLVGLYCAGLIGNAVMADLSLSRNFLNRGDKSKASLTRTIDKLLKASNADVDDWHRDYRRNPWIVEAISHLISNVSADNDNLFSRRVIALKPVHTAVSQQGVDILGIAISELGASLCIGESKATRDAPDNQLSKSITFYRSIDNHERDDELRTQSNLLSLGLSPQVKEMMYDCFWEDSRFYFPLIAFCGSCDFRPKTQRRTTFGQLKPESRDKVLITIALSSFHSFFDDVSDQIRTSVDSLTVG